MTTSATNKLWVVLRRVNGHMESVTGPVVGVETTSEAAVARAAGLAGRYPENVYVVFGSEQQIAIKAELAVVKMEQT